MLDIRLLRELPDAVKTRLAARNAEFAPQVDAVLAVDEERRSAETRLQDLNAERNRVSKEIGALKSQGLDAAELQAGVKTLGNDIAECTCLAGELEEKQRDLLLRLPNLPHENAPVGTDAAANPVLREWGTKPDFENPEDHVAIGQRLGLFSPELGAKISGSGFMVYTGRGARLERALISFLLDLHTTQHGYTEVSPPFLIRRECMVGTSQLPKFEEDMYGMEDGAMFLAPTAEVPVTNLRREEIVDATELPIRYTAYTPCFRREAGSAGRDTRGLIRMHQFDKVELVQIVHPSESYAALEALTGHAEKVLQLLGLHYRTIELCTGDLGFGSAKTYDIEVWAPGQNAYLEVSSCSNFEDYQARRMNLRFKDPETRKNVFCHTLNGSGTALPRLYVALIESGLQPDGSVLLPERLASYMGGDRVLQA